MGRIYDWILASGYKERLLGGCSGKVTLIIRKKKRAMAHLVSSLCFLCLSFFLSGMRKCWLEFQEPLCEGEAGLRKEATGQRWQNREGPWWGHGATIPHLICLSLVFQISATHSWTHFLTDTICKAGIPHLLLLNRSYSVHTTGTSMGNKILKPSQPIHMDGHHMVFPCCQGQSN